MKILPILLINLVVTGGALVIYDQMQGDKPGGTYDMGADGVDLSDIEARIASIEARGDNAPGLATAGGEAILRRLEALEAGNGSSTADGSEGGMRTADAPAGSGAPSSGSYTAAEGDVSEEEINRFRKVMDAANEQRRLEREREQLANLLERLEISMDDKQQEKYLAARRDRQTKMRDVFRNLRRGEGVDREQMMEQINEGRAKVNEEFAVVINKFLPSGDAAKLVEHEGNNRWGGMTRRMGSDGGRRGR